MQKPLQKPPTSKNNAKMQQDKGPGNGSQQASLSYRQSGVNISGAEAFIEALTPLANSTGRPGFCEGLGGFGGLFDLGATGFVDPILVAGTDGVGTKLILAAQSQKHDGIGVDLVAMCVNDILCHGAEPLFFLDYFAMASLSGELALIVAGGIAEGCHQAGCALIGGETAEMPGFYAPGHYDLAGFAVGAVERGSLLPDKASMQAGDVLIGLGSSGVHANGFSLIREILVRTDYRLADPAPFDRSYSLAEALLRPTRIYVRSVEPLFKSGWIKGLAHITGGGAIDNVRRICPPDLRPAIDFAAIPPLPVFDWLAETGPVKTSHMREVFNMGVGMIIVSGADNAPKLLEALQQAGEDAFRVGELIECK